MYLSNKISGERLHNFIKNFHLLVANANSLKVNEINLYKMNLKELGVTPDRVYELFIDMFRETKVLIY